jgi:hypothetical protein
VVLLGHNPYQSPVQPLPAPSFLLTFHPLLLERSYGGGGEAIYLLLQGSFALLVVAVILTGLVKLSNRAEEFYEDGYRNLMNKLGIAVVVFIVIYALTSIGSH